MKPTGEWRVICCSVSFSSVSNIAGYRKCLCDNFEGISNLEHEPKCVKVQRIIVPCLQWKTAALNSFIVFHKIDMSCPIDTHIFAHESFFMLCECFALSLGCRGRAWATWSEWPQLKWQMCQQPFSTQWDIYKAELDAAYSSEMIYRADSWSMMARCRSQLSCVASTNC